MTLAAVARAESALEAARREAEEAQRALGMARKEAEEAKRNLGLFQEEVEEAKRRGAADLGRACAAEVELAKTKAELRACRHQLDIVNQEVRELEGRTENAEEIALMADTRAVDADAKVADATAQTSEALKRARDVEERAAAAEGAATEAVDSFGAPPHLLKRWRRASRTLIFSAFKMASDTGREKPRGSPTSRASTT